MKTLVITANLENEIKDIRALEAKINELDELKKEKEALVKSVLDTAGVEEMGVHVFRYCSKLVGATFLPLVPPVVSDIGNSLFQDCSALEYISVPLESVDAYKELFFDFIDIITGESVTSN